MTDYKTIVAKIHYQVRERTWKTIVQIPRCILCEDVLDQTHQEFWPRPFVLFYKTKFGPLKKKWECTRKKKQKTQS